VVLTGSVDNPFATPDGAYRRVPRYVALAPLVRGRRVLELGFGDGGGAAYLAAGRAREVVATGADADAIEAATKALGRPGLRFQWADPAALPFPDASFDAVIALDGTGRASAPDALDEIRRVLTPEGLLALGLDNPSRNALAVAGEGGPAPGDDSGHGLQETLRRHFARVTLIGQAPVVGFLFADLSVPDGGRAAPGWNEGLLGSELEELDAWIALCWGSKALPSPFDPALIRLSFEALASHMRSEASEHEGHLRELADQSHQAEEFQRRLDELESTIQASIEGGEPPGSGGAGQGEPAEAEGVERSRLVAELAQREERIEALEHSSLEPTAQARDAERRLQEVEAELELARERLESSRGETSEKHLEVEGAARRAESLEMELRELRRERTRLAAEVAAREVRIQALEDRITEGVSGTVAAPPSAPVAEMPAERAYRQALERAAALGEALRERENRITALEAEILSLGARKSDEGAEKLPGALDSSGRGAFDDGGD
jgi:SAM-dependent methyltransferase